jgi:glycosyltransferase involved in cell wall biosynthesis
MPALTISVIIPAYNAGRTIGATLDSVLGQTLAPDEILVMDDGSTDDTRSILTSYGSRVTVLAQQNYGSAVARNALWARATGGMVALLDSDDIWHPQYLEFQRWAFERYPHAALFFAGHVNFQGFGRFNWNRNVRDERGNVEFMAPLQFLKRYYGATGPFTSPSYCCIRKSALDACPQPFKVHGADDSYLFTLVPLLGGSVVYDPTPLVAYRVVPTSLSANTLWIVARSIDVFEALADHYAQTGDRNLLVEFQFAYASRLREYARLLARAGNIRDARKHFAVSIAVRRAPESMAKSFVLLLLACLPKILQPDWRQKPARAAHRAMEIGTAESE